MNYESGNAQQKSRLVRRLVQVNPENYFLRKRPSRAKTPVPNSNTLDGSGAVTGPPLIAICVAWLTVPVQFAAVLPPGPTTPKKRSLTAKSKEPEYVAF